MFAFNVTHIASWSNRSFLISIFSMLQLKMPVNSPWTSIFFAAFMGNLGHYDHNFIVLLFYCSWLSKKSEQNSVVLIKTTSLVHNSRTFKGLLSKNRNSRESLKKDGNSLKNEYFYYIRYKKKLCTGEHNVEQLFPSYISGSRSWFARYLWKTVVTTTTLNSEYNFVSVAALDAGRFTQY